MEHKTDAGNALRFVRQYGDVIRYVAEWKGWLVWDGERWKPDTTGQIMELAKETVRSIYREAGELDSEDNRKELVKWALFSENASRLKALVELAKTDQQVAISSAELDLNTWLLNCTNGTIDLRTGKLRKADKADLITKTTGVEYDPQAECGEFDRFITWAMADRSEMVEFLQRAIGYSLTGDVSERIILFCYGKGRNGKSTLLKTVHHVMGDYGLRVDASIFLQTRRDGSSATPGLAQVRGKRYVFTSEMEDGTHLASALIKTITGDEMISTRRLYKDPEEWMPAFKPWIASNHLPNAPSDDQAIWDRMRLVPFDNRVGDRQQDKELGDKLKAEAPGILAWAVQGCLAWQTDGLSVPDAVAIATAGYRESQDDFASFLEELEELTVPPDMHRSPLHELYGRWARLNGQPVLNVRQFKAQMEAHGYEIATQERYWRLNSERKAARRAALIEDAKGWGTIAEAVRSAR
jgi:putative DNA primase/helicase